MLSFTVYWSIPAIDFFLLENNTLTTRKPYPINIVLENSIADTATFLLCTNTMLVSLYFRRQKHLFRNLFEIVLFSFYHHHHQPPNSTQLLLNEGNVQFCERNLTSIILNSGFISSALSFFLYSTFCFMRITLFYFYAIFCCCLTSSCFVYYAVVYVIADQIMYKTRKKLKALKLINTFSLTPSHVFGWKVGWNYKEGKKTSVKVKKWVLFWYTGAYAWR